MLPGINLNMRVTNNIMAGVVRHSGKADVTVGIDFNTPNKFVFDYLSKLCVVVNQSVIYSKIETGAWKGKYSGERKYQMDFSKSPSGGRLLAMT